jgi:RNA polymerase sigma-70 factor (ECF subfamily)
MDSSSIPTSEGLLRVARGGNEEALGELLQHFRHYLELLARVELGRRLQTKLDTADLVQDTFLEAHRHFKSFRGTTEAASIRSCRWRARRI